MRKDQFFVSPDIFDLVQWQVTSRAEFERLRVAVPDTLTDLERAVWLWRLLNPSG